MQKIFFENIQSLFAKFTFCESFYFQKNFQREITINKVLRKGNNQDNCQFHIIPQYTITQNKQKITGTIFAHKHTHTHTLPHAQ